MSQKLKTIKVYDGTNLTLYQQFVNAIGARDYHSNDNSKKAICKRADSLWKDLRKQSEEKILVQITQILNEARRLQVKPPKKGIRRFFGAATPAQHSSETNDVVELPTPTTPRKSPRKRPVKSADITFDIAPNASAQRQLFKEIQVIEAEISQIEIKKSTGDSDLISEQKAALLRKERLEKLKQLEKKQKAASYVKKSKLKHARQQIEEGIYTEKLPVGRPATEVVQPGLKEAILFIVNRNGGSAHEKRRNEIINCVMTLKDLTNYLRAEGFDISMSTTYTYIMPRRTNTAEGFRHWRAAPGDYLTLNQTLLLTSESRPFDYCCPSLVAKPEITSKRQCEPCKRSFGSIANAKSHFNLNHSLKAMRQRNHNYLLGNYNNDEDESDFSDEEEIYMSELDYTDIDSEEENVDIDPLPSPTAPSGMVIVTNLSRDLVVPDGLIGKEILYKHDVDVPRGWLRGTVKGPSKLTGKEIEDGFNACVHYTKSKNAVGFAFEEATELTRSTYGIEKTWVLIRKAVA